MLSTRAVWRTGFAMLAAGALVTTMPAPASAQGPNEGAVTISGGIDFANGYMFRGLRQDRTAEQFRRGSLRTDSDLVVFPRLDLGVRLWQGQGDLRSVGVRLETANRLHTGPTGRRSESLGMWNESELTMAVQLGFGRGVAADFGYTNYTSPNNLGLVTRELFVKVMVDDSQRGRGSVRPYGIIASEFDTRRTGSANCLAQPGRPLGRALEPGELLTSCVGGTYAELGATPHYDGGRYQVDVPVRVGLSIKDYYRHPETFTDNKFGFFSAGVIGNLPFTTGPTRLGSWVLRGGVEWHRLGTTPEAWNVDKDGATSPNRVVGIVGVGFSY